MSAGRGGGGGGNSKQANAAVAKLVADIESGETKIPTFNWRFRDGFGTVPIGAAGMSRIADAFLNCERHCCNCLELQNQQIGDEGSKALARVLQQDARISQLNVAKNKIGEAGAVDIGTALFSNATLTRLIFDDNPIGCDGIKQLSAGIVACPSLTYCDLGVGTGQLLGDDAIIALSELLRKPNLLHFKISGVDAVSPTALAALMGALPLGGSSLSELCINNCVPLDAAEKETAIISNAMNLLGKALTSASASITSVELRLPIGDQGAQVLARALPNTTSLESLNVSRCGINATGLVAIAKGLATNRSLTKLNVSLQGEQTRSNERAQESMVEFCRALQTNTKLTELNVADLPMTDAIAEQLIDSISIEACSIKSVRYSAVPSDALGTRLANLLAEKERQIAQRKRTPPPSTGNTPRKQSASGVFSLRSASESQIADSRILAATDAPPVEVVERPSESNLEPTASVIAANAHDNVGAQGPNTLAAMIADEAAEHPPESDDEEMVDIEF